MIKENSIAEDHLISVPQYILIALVLYLTVTLLRLCNVP